MSKQMVDQRNIYISLAACVTDKNIGNINIRLRWLFAEYVLTACVIVFTMLFCLTMGE
jgi:hypothetical protein